MSYHLTKLHIKEGHTSAVHVGQNVKGNEMKVIRRLGMESLQVGDELYVSNGADFIKTSPIQRIEPNDKGYTIWTETSVYHLEKGD